ncbi:DUF7686 domain-containing protein [Indiicoccus explosivorum]|uniref:DUF7686 domain-containing protein n=1 Tax=Indiicoccus explosivorum TaxID=1917864 RepID=UPI000B4351E8|nr:hypothetical protein [Indiicoccus explosivorum]
MASCQVCESEEPYIHFGEEHLCLNCFNGKMTEELGVEAESYPEEVVLRDGEGKSHRFRLRKRLDPIGIIMEAEELTAGGYQFTLHGELGADQGELLLQLIAKTERGMREKYVKQGRFPKGQPYSTLQNDRLAGRIEWNPSEEGVPLLAVDGESYRWGEIGRMLMTYEGFTVKIETLDPSEEVIWEEEE